MMWTYIASQFESQFRFLTWRVLCDSKKCRGRNWEQEQGRRTVLHDGLSGWSTDGRSKHRRWPCSPGICPLCVRNSGMLKLIQRQFWFELTRCRLKLLNLEQIVLMTDGTDTRPYRLNWPSPCVIFDLSPVHMHDTTLRKMAGTVCTETCCCSCWCRPLIWTVVVLVYSVASCQNEMNGVHMFNCEWQCSHLTSRAVHRETYHVLVSWLAKRPESLCRDRVYYNTSRRTFHQMTTTMKIGVKSCQGWATAEKSPVSGC